MSALDIQVGGDHYKKYKIQPMEYSMANGLDACQHTAIKYITRFRDKGGIADLEKAKHCIDMLIEFERKATEYPTPEIAAEAAAGLYEIDFPAPGHMPPVRSPAAPDSESEATHRDAGGAKYKQAINGRWLMWGGPNGWFYAFGDAFKNPDDLKPLELQSVAPVKAELPEGFIAAVHGCPPPPLPNSTRMMELMNTAGEVFTTVWDDAFHNENWANIAAYRFNENAPV